MAETGSKRIRSGGRSCNSKRSTARLGVRVVHISNPTIKVNTSESEFRVVVQSLTGRNRSITSRGEVEEINLYSDDHYSHKVNVPKLLLEDEVECLNDMNSSESAITANNVSAAKDYCNNKLDDGDVTIFEELEVLPIQSPDYILSQQVFETLESIGDTSHILFNIFSPSLFSSEYEYL